MTPRLIESPLEPPRDLQTAWILNDGKIGTLNQCLGLAERLGIDAVIKIIEPRLPWRRLPARWWPMPLRAQRQGGDRLEPPWPDVVISCGRATAAPAAAIRAASAGRTVAIAVQDPRLDPGKFDLIIVASHDRLRGANVIATEGALNRVTRAKLAEGAARFESHFARLPRLLVAVLIGGSNNRYRLDAAGAAEMGQRLAALSATTGCGLVVTPSRRSGADVTAALKAQLPPERSWFWDGSGENPYFAMLGTADHILVTADSISMASEAAVTGRPVHILDLPGGGGKFGAFHERLRALGIARPFDGTLPEWSYPPLDDTASATAAVRALLDARQAAS